MLPRLRDLLTDRGRLLLALPQEPPDELERHHRELVVLLSELGFVILDEGREIPPPEIEPGSYRASLWLSARRDRFTVRSYHQGDESAILNLFRTSFHTERSLEHWRWKFIDNPFGRLHLSCAFSPEGELAAHHGAYPVPFRQHDGATVLGFQVGDLMTDRRFRRVGLGPRSLLARCARHAYAAFGSRAAFHYGFNTDTSLEYSLRYMRARRVEPVGFWVRDAASAAPATSRLRVAAEAAFDPSFDRFFERVAPSYGFLVERRSTYLQWRYPERPDVEYLTLSVYRWRKRVGWSVFSRRDERLIWGDALFDPRHVTEAAPALLSAALASSLGRGAERIEAWFSRRPRWWVEALEDLGFTLQDEPHGLWMTCVPHNDLAAVERLRGLYYSMGDGDLF